MGFTGFLVMFGILLLIAGCWFGLHYLVNPPLNSPDGEAKITGNCGDTMELALKFEQGRVEQTRTWTDGCSISKQCLEAAAMLARGKTVTELEKITMLSVMEISGKLPDSHLHCAQLAETTLHHAVKDYLKNHRATSLPS